MNPNETRPRPGQDDASATADGGPGNIDQIRDIIFGTQMRDYDRRFAQLEERLLRDSTELREELSRRVTALEDYMRREVDTLVQKLAGEGRTRTAQLQELGSGVEQLGQKTERRFGEFGEEVSQAHRDLRGDLARLASSASEELQRRAGELAAQIKREADELHTRKTDRAALGALFAEMAARLAEEFRRPNDA
jgi:predicted transcriptional regulator